MSFYAIEVKSNLKMSNIDAVGYIDLAACKKGYLYRLLSRNLRCGVFDGKLGFIGIRTKFSDRFLFTEYHWDVGPANYGTAMPKEEICQLPDDILPVEDLGTIDELTRRPVAFDSPIKQGGRGWFFIDSNEADDCIRPITNKNVKLFQFLDRYALPL